MGYKLARKEKVIEVITHVIGIKVIKRLILLFLDEIKWYDHSIRIVS